MSDNKLKMRLQVSVHRHRHGQDVHVWWIPDDRKLLGEKEIVDQLEDFEDDREDEWVDVYLFDDIPTEEEARQMLDGIRQVVKIR